MSGGKSIGKSKLSKKYQITIPKTVRVILGLNPGDEVEFILEGEDRILIKKA